MTTLTKTIIKRNTIEKARSVYKSLSDSFKNFKLSIDKLREQIDQIDLTNPLIKTNFGNNYNILLSDLVTSITNILQTRRTIIGDNGSLIIRPVDVETSSYFTEIWYNHTTVTLTNEQRFPPRIVCKYDNFSIVNILDIDNNVIGFTFLIGDKTYSLYNSENLGLDSSNDVIVQTVIEQLTLIITTSSYLQEYCSLNESIINRYKSSFDVLYS